MIWIFFTLIGALCNATYNLAVKKMTDTWNLYLIAASTYLFSAIILLVVSSIVRFPVLGNDFLIALFMTGFINILATILYFNALKISDISACIPMLSFTPFFLVITSFIVLNEIPTGLGFLGIFLIIAGSFIVTARGNGCIRLSGLPSVFRDRGIIYMIIVAFLFSVASVYDKILVQQSDPFFGSAIKMLFIGTGFFMITFMFERPNQIFLAFREPMALKIGIIRALEAITINYSLLLTIVPYVISVKRLSITMSVILGGYFFKEQNMVPRLYGSAIMIFGTVLILL